MASNHKPIDQLTRKDVLKLVGDEQLLDYSESAGYLGLTSQGALGAAIKGRAELFDGEIVRSKLGLYPSNLIFKSALDAYIAQRGTRVASDNMKWFMIRTDETGAAALRDQGFTVVKPTDRAKQAKDADTNGVNAPVDEPTTVEPTV